MAVMPQRVLRLLRHASRGHAPIKPNVNFLNPIAKKPSPDSTGLAHDIFIFSIPQSYMRAFRIFRNTRVMAIGYIG